MPLHQTLSESWRTIQSYLFPWVEEEIGPLTEKQKQLVTVLEVVRVEDFVARVWPGLPGRPLSSRAALARAFVAKAVYRLRTTRLLIECVKADKALRRLIGWERRGEVPSETTFSHAFAEFAVGELPARVHAALIEKTHRDRLVGHISRDSTAIEAREKPVKVAKPDKPKRKRGRPRKGEVVVKEPRRLEYQGTMTLAEMLADLPKHCNVGTKRDAHGHKLTWIGYKLSIDVADGDIPVSCLLTSASAHDSQMAIPLATITAERVTNCYDVMDKAYDAAEIKAKSRELGHVAIIAPNPRRIPGGKKERAAEAKRRRYANYKLPEDVRYNERSAVERVNGRLKDDFGGRDVRVRGHAKVFCHLMFGILALTADQLMRLVQ